MSLLPSGDTLPWAGPQKPPLQQLLSEIRSPSRRWPAGGTSAVLGPVGDFLSPLPLHGALVQCENPPTSSATVPAIYISSAVPYVSLLMAWAFPVEVLLFINLLFAHSHFTESGRRHRDPQELEERAQRLAAYGNADSSWKPEAAGASVHRAKAARAPASSATDTTAVRLPEARPEPRNCRRTSAHWTLPSTRCVAWSRFVDGI